MVITCAGHGRVDVGMVERAAVAKGAGLVISSTVAVTVAFLGVLSLITGVATGLSQRFPYYVVAFTVAFTALVISLERYLDEGDQILLTATILSVTIGILFMLDVEGLIYASTNPGEIVASQLLLYLIAAGCLCTGLVYWGVHHWREYVS